MAVSAFGTCANLKAARMKGLQKVKCLIPVEFMTGGEESGTGESDIPETS